MTGDAAVGGFMKVAVAAESDPGESRVAATPETVKKMIGLGAELAVEPGAGIKSGILDADFHSDHRDKGSWRLPT